MRRVHLRHADNIRKRVLIHVGAFNLSLIMRKTLGHGTPRGLPKLMIQLVLKLRTLTSSLRQIITQSPDLNISLEMASATGC